MNSGASSFQTITSGGGGIGAALLRTALRPASILYECIINHRNRKYDSGALQVQRVDVPVISIGNITTGGAGKTPLVIEVATRLRAMGRRPAVVSRGYRSGPDGYNDEMVLISQRVPGIPCIANPDRVAGARDAVTTHHADSIVLDDGFQHRRIARDVDMVVVDATRPFGGGFMLPRGDLREPIRGLARATLLVITRADQVLPPKLDALRTRLKEQVSDTPIIAAQHTPEPLRSLLGELSSAADLHSLPVYLMSAIGNPAAFEQTARQACGNICGHSRFRDHHRYTSKDAAAASEKARIAGAAAVVVTEKDAVKLSPMARQFSVPVYVLGIRIDFLDDGGKIMDAVLREAICGGMAADGTTTVPTGRSKRA